MKKNILNIQVINRFSKKYFKILFSVALIFTLVVAIPVISINAYAALLEDCDLDGYDDATGVPVPWPGYDETKGDTPSGPGGVITSTKAATSTTTATTAATTAAQTAHRLRWLEVQEHQVQEHQVQELQVQEPQVRQVQVIQAQLIQGPLIQILRALEIVKWLLHQQL